MRGHENAAGLTHALVHPAGAAGQGDSHRTLLHSSCRTDHHETYWSPYLILDLAAHAKACVLILY